MNTSLSWIKAYVPDLDVTAQEYTDAMTLSGTKVEGFTKLDADLDKIVVGQIEKIEKHPDADKLVVCQVNIGAEVIQIVTGAPNVKVGDNVTLGIGNEAPNKLRSDIYNSGLVTIGENSVIPAGVQIGKNTAISGITVKEDYVQGALESGGVLIKAGDRS